MAVTFTDNSAAVRAALDAAKKRALTACGASCEGFAKALSPVDTGRLRDSITYTVQESSTTIGTNVEYAPYVEFGTYKMSAKPYLKPAVLNNVETYVRLIRDEYGKL